MYVLYGCNNNSNNIEIYNYMHIIINSKLSIFRIISSSVLRIWWVDAHCYCPFWWAIASTLSRVSCNFWYETRVPMWDSSNNHLGWGGNLYIFSWLSWIDWVYLCWLISSWSCRMWLIILFSWQIIGWGCTWVHMS